MLQIDAPFEAFPDVLRRKTRPNDVGEVSGAVIEDVHADSWIVRGRETCIAGAEARSHDTEAIESPLLEPVEAAADVDNGLAGRIRRPSDIG